MFYQTYTARKPPLAYTAVTPSPPCCDTMVLSPAACGLQRTAHTLQCIVNGDDSVVFPVLSLMTLTFDLDIQTRPSEGPNVFRLNLAQIYSSIPEIFE